MRGEIEDLARDTARLVAALEEGQRITLLHRGREVGTFVPTQERRSIADHPAVGMWRDRDDLRDPEAFIRSLRRTRQVTKR